MQKVSKKTRATNRKKAANLTVIADCCYSIIDEVVNAINENKPRIPEQLRPK